MPPIIFPGSLRSGLSPAATLSAETRNGVPVSRLEPKLRGEIVPVNVDVRRFIRLVTEKVHAVRTAS
jgi:hypothetical protein